jgi:beta-glucosidase
LSVEEIERFVARLDLDQKLRLIRGARPTLARVLGLIFAYNRTPIVVGEWPERGVPGIRFCDGPRGVVMHRSTCFPVPIARGATWDPQLEERVAEAIGIEALAQGANLWAGVCVNLLRHPGWGRAQETYGEDPVLLGRMGAAAVRGAQRHVAACVKHFAAYSIERARFRVDVRIGARALHEVYLPHFRACIEAGAAAVMTAYPRVNGDYCGESRELITDILKRRWKFDGLVMSDFFYGIHDGPRALAAGLDLEMPFVRKFGRKLRRALERGVVPMARLDDAVTRAARPSPGERLGRCCGPEAHRWAGPRRPRPRGSRGIVCPGAQ